jgi:hypothetical protein
MSQSVVGEVAVVDTSAAERRALRIGLRLDAIADNYEAVMPLIREAIEMGDHATLGYASPGAYLSDRFGKSLARLPIPVRRSAVAELTAAGLSTRAIAPVVGVSQQQVSKDVRQVTPKASPGPDYVTDEADLIVDHDTGEILDTPPAKVTGLDGKTYTRPEPKAAPSNPRPAKVDSATVALLNDLRGPWRRGITREARRMTPEARAHLIEALETTLSEIKEIQL